MKTHLDIDTLIQEAAGFAEAESLHHETTLFGVTDGKAVGTYLEHKFKLHLNACYTYAPGNSASGIDFPELGVDIKVTSINQPQSSCPFKAARQKIYGLGYHLLIFVYEKSDDAALQAAHLNIKHTIFVHKDRTADHQMTRGILEIIARNGNIDDLVGFFQDRMLPVDEIMAHTIAEEVLQNPPLQGYLTISNALQWRLQYSRVIQKAGEVDGLYRVR